MNALMNPFVAASAKGAAWMLVWSWQAAVLLACAWAGLKIFRVKSPALRHQVWLFALIAAVAMPVLSGVVQKLPLPKSNNKALSYAVELPRIVITSDHAPLVQSPSPAVIAKPSAKQPIILSLSFVLWLSGALILATKAGINVVRLRRLRDGARRASLADLDCAECDCETLCSGKVRLSLSDEIGSPILLGVLRPMIVFPADIADWTTPTERCAMLRHELAHVARRDHYVNFFQTILGAVFFFHPLARYACRQLAVEREMACDDHVVGSGAEAEAYAECIIKAAERSIALAGAPGGAHQLALFSARQILERRIEMILNKDRVRITARKWRYRILPAALIAIIAWLLLPAGLTKPGRAQRLAQQTVSDDLNELVARYAEDSKNFDDLVEMALTNPDLDMRKKAVLRLYIIEGDGSSTALVKIYDKSGDPEVKTMVIDMFGRRSEIEPLTKIALSDPSPEYRRRALYRIKWLKENSASGDIKAWDVSALQDQLNELSKEPPAPPPPPPSPAETDEPQEGVTVEYDKPPGPYRWQMGQATEYVQLIRQAIYAYMRQDTSFFEQALDKSYTGSGPGGEIIYKEQEIMAVKQGDRKIKRFDFDLLHISVRGDTAFSTFQGTVYYDDNGRESLIPYRYTVNLIKKDGQPKITAIHKSRMQ